MKKSFHSVACAATIATTMLLQIFAPSVVLAIDTTEDTEPSTTIETTVTSETSIETSADVIEPSDTTSNSTDYTEVTEDLTETEADVTEVTEEEVISSETNTDPTAVTETEETVETLETEEIEYVVFDHYYSDIDSSLVTTTELFVITSDSSVFTRNTNVVSNYDDAFIIECSSVEEARFVYSYYVDKVDFITDMSDVASVATDDVDETTPVVDETEGAGTEETAEVSETTVPEETVVETEPATAETTAETTTVEPTPVEQEPDLADLSDLNNGNDAIANLNGIDTVHNDYSGYIALIDTGANAHANFTVLGGDTFDYNGHGTSMFGYIRSENPSAQVISIKVSEDGTATAADIYAGFRLAIDLNVSVINFSMTAPDTAKNAVIRDIIQEAIDAGIVVIGAAGNNSISATHFIPGCIDGVITIGAVDADGNKIRSSNYNADYYVVADSTSEATARYTGLYTAGLADISLNVFDQVVEDDDYVPDDYAWAYEVAEELTNRLQEEHGYGYVTFEVDEDGNVWFVYHYETDDGFIVSDWPTADATINLDHDVSYTVSGTSFSGTCDFTSTNGGKGYATNFSDTLGGWLAAAGISQVPFICSKNFGEEDSNHALSLESGPMNYVATYQDGQWTICIGSRHQAAQPVWTEITDTVAYTIGNPSGQYLPVTVGGTTRYVNLAQGASAVVTEVQDLVRNMTVVGEYNGNKGCRVTVPSTGYGTHYATRVYWHTDDTQTYEAQITWSHENPHGAVSFQKVDGNNTRLSGATIYFVCTAGDGLGHEGDLRVRASTVASYDAVTYNGRLGVQFVTNGNIVTIEMLSPNSTYMFYEAVPPTNPDTGLPYDRAPSVYVTTDANGNATPATVTMVDSPGSDGNFGSYSITKTWTASSETSNYFWDSVEQINFGLYAIGWTADNIRQYVTQTSTPLGGVSQLAMGSLTEPSTGNSATVWWELIGGEGSSVRGAQPEYWEFWGNCGQGCGHDPGWHRWSELNGTYPYFVGLPRERYFVATESWTSYMMDGSVEDYYVDTLNNSGWHDIGGGNGSHRYVAIYYVGRNGVTYMCDWDTLQPIYALSLHQSPTGRYFDDEYYFDIVDNEEAAGSLDVVKIDETGLGVDGVRFELRSGDNPDNLLGTGSIGNSIGQVQGFDAYNVLWNYTLIKPGYIRWQYPWGTNSGEGDNDDAVHLERQVLGPAYNIRDLVPDGDMTRVLVTASRIPGHHDDWSGEYFLERYRDYLQWVADGEPHPYTGGHPINSQYMYNYSNDLWYGTAALRSDEVTTPVVYPRNFGFGPNFNLETGNLNEIRETNAEFVSHLNYGDYYIYEYIEDANGNNIIGTNGYETPEGWSAYDGNNDGVPEYFYIRVTVGECQTIQSI